MGSRLAVNEVVNDDVRARYRALTNAEKAAINDKHEELRQDERTGKAVSDRGDHQQAVAKFRALDLLVSTVL